MKKELFFLLILNLILSSSTCKKNSTNCHNELYVKNDSYYRIVSTFYDSYPDTSIGERDIFLGRTGINTNGKYVLTWGQRSCFEALFNGGGASEHLLSDTLIVFIFNYDTLQTYQWETIRRDYRILKRYDLSLKDLNQLNWEVSYPPTPGMKNIKQFPKYGE